MPRPKSKDLARACARLADEKKAENVLVLHVAPVTPIADYFVLATSRNPRQIRAMAQDMKSDVEALGVKVVGVEGTAESGWVLLDFGDVVAHLFDAPTRELYGLEMLWGDAPVVKWEKKARARPRKGKT